MANTDNFRALASVVASESANIDQSMRTKAKSIMNDLIDIMAKEADIEMAFLVQQSAKLNGLVNIE
jgi:hypothetical protein